MQFKELPLKGAYEIGLDNLQDDRGFFARCFCVEEFRELNLDASIAQVNTAFSSRKGTLRGMHYQLPPNSETKIVRCTRGAIFDVILDIRTGSETFGQWYGTELTEDNHRTLYVPKGFAHGYLTITDNSEVLYLTTEFYCRERERTIRWNDPKFAIEFPFAPAIISDKDSSAPDFDPVHHLEVQSEQNQ